MIVGALIIFFLAVEPTARPVYGSWQGKTSSVAVPLRISNVVST